MRPRGEVEQGGPGDGAGAIGVPELPSWTMVRYVIAVTAYVLAGTHTYVWRTDTRLFERVSARSVSREAFVFEMWASIV
jgi:hypothetical protein